MLVTTGPQKGQVVQWTDDVPLRLGRGADADFTLDDPKLDAHHAEIVQRGGQWFIRDLGSESGTFVNLVRIRDFVRLADSDQIILGDSVLAFCTAPAEQGGAPHAPAAHAGQAGDAADGDTWSAAMQQVQTGDEADDEREWDDASHSVTLCELPEEADDGDLDAWAAAMESALLAAGDDRVGTVDKPRRSPGRRRDP